jgi:hypothetical protein
MALATTSDWTFNFIIGIMSQDVLLELVDTLVSSSLVLFGVGGAQQRD